MKGFFELLKNRIGFSRIGRISLSKDSKKFISTPSILIPINKTLMKLFYFIEEFEGNDLFLISGEKYLKKDFIHEKFRNSVFLFTHLGTIERFNTMLMEKKNLIIENNVIPIIPFNIPTATIGKDFTKKEIEHYLSFAEKILKKNQNINFALSIKIFGYHEFISLYLPIINNNENIKILNLIDIFDNLRNYRNILKNFMKLKQDIDNNIILLASGRIIPKMYPMLIYLGIDVIDCSYSSYLSSENFYDSIEHLLPIYKIKYLPCSCRICSTNLSDILIEKYSTEKMLLLCLHNLIIAKNYMNKIKQYLEFEDFRAFVEKSTMDDTNLISMLKILDKEYFELIRYETPITQKNKIINCLGPSSYYRPDFQEFREKTIKTFTPEPSTAVIILLPCSSKKPYSESKSHKKFFNAIRKFPEFPTFQEIILTSPLGAIPRQLENVYPVNSYEISVTGEWDNEELNIAANMLVSIIEKYNKDIPIICHLEGGYLEIVKRAQQKLNHNFYFSEVYEKVISNDSLLSLENLIKEHKNDFEVIQPDISLTKTWTRKIIKILDYQFGSGSGIKLLSNGLKFKKNRDQTKLNLFDRSTDELLGVFNFPLGQIALNINGAQRLSLFSSSNILVFNDKEIRGNTLFRPGILEFSNNLIPSNYVIILDQDKQNIVGIGQLIVGSNFIKNSKTGRIAKLI